MRCYHYKGFNHLKRDCLEQKKGDDGSSTTLVAVADKLYDDVLAVSTGIDTYSHDEWVMNVGSIHV